MPLSRSIVAPLLLLLLSAGIPAAWAAPPVWRTSADLIAASPASFTRLDKAGVEAVIRRLPKTLAQIPDYLRTGDAAVHLHKGDLTIDGSFANDDILVVDGNLVVRGSYDDYRSRGIGILVVLGDFRAEHVVSWGSIAVTGTLQATGLVYAYYNDFTFEVAGPVRARAVVIFDKSTNTPRIEASVVQTEHDAGVEAALRHFVPELMIEDVLDKADPEATSFYAVASYDAARERIGAGRPVFREQPAPATLLDDVLRLFKRGVDAATQLRLAKADRLLAMIVASGESIPIEVQRHLAASGDPAVLERLAANPKADRAIVRRIREARPR